MNEHYFQPLQVDLSPGWKKVEHWSQKIVSVPRKYFPKKGKNCNNLDNRINSEENSHHDLRNEIINASNLNSAIVNKRRLLNDEP
jgi:hypothetical protein